ncbi:nitrate- and nitrite sensing domain-containing protein [Dactylosporangium sp. AC04546]|uniref:ATP-binding protein n=1 Tax=Dactylosporangium sp. AC04546 TaxID=2862460 RepID=UPI001EDD1967|nr:ATP-binding protein [Dactylosporangium sp. AC04546]WVK85748.1 nitrate- and nitrite sensing domain-containing protein [Dactylosporangium sp. AC04546]
MEQRRRRLRLADLPVVAKLGLILVVPLLGLLVLTGYAVSAAIAAGPGDLRGVTAVAAEAGHVADGLQRERLALAQGAPTVAEAAVTDAAIERFRERVARLDAGDAAGPPLRKILDALIALRATPVTQGPLQPVLLQYGQVIADLAAFQQAIADRPAPAAVRSAARAAGWLAVAREELALVQVSVVRGVTTPADQQRLIAHRGAHLDAVRRFTADAPAAWRAALDAVPSAEEAAAVDRALLGGPVDPAFPRLAVAHLDGLGTVADLAAADTLRLAGDARGGQQRTIVAGFALLLVVVAGSIAVVVIVGRSTAGALRALQAGAFRIAYERLPQTVRALQEADAATAHQVAAQQTAATDVPVAGRDEIGRVAEAFNAVQREAVRAAAEQAALRAGVSTAFVNLARRGQRLVDSLVERLDTAERDEADPDRLAQLFGFDHLAARIRHDNQSLLVLAGIDPSRAHRRPVALYDLLRAAQSQILDYERVEYGRIDTDAALAPEAVDGIVHLLAELFDNAARHAPLGEPVLVDTRRAGEGLVIEVADHGPGLAADRLADLNRRLAEPPPLDVADSRRMGLAVVARLAARHGVDVHLEPAPSGGGLVAVVRVPAGLVRAAEPVTVAPVASGQREAGQREAGQREAGQREAGQREALPRLLERSAALPGGEPVDVPAPRNGTTVVPVVPGPRVAPDGPTVDAESARLLSKKPTNTAKSVSTEGHSTT